MRCGTHQRKELERLCRYITRSAIANERLKRDGAGVSGSEVQGLRLKAANDTCRHLEDEPDVALIRRWLWPVCIVSVALFVAVLVYLQ